MDNDVSIFWDGAQEAAIRVDNSRRSRFHHTAPSTLVLIAYPDDADESGGVLVGAFKAVRYLRFTQLVKIPAGYASLRLIEIDEGGGATIERRFRLSSDTIDVCEKEHYAIASCSAYKAEFHLAYRQSSAPSLDPETVVRTELQRAREKQRRLIRVVHSKEHVDAESTSDSRSVRLAPVELAYPWVSDIVLESLSKYHTIEQVGDRQAPGQLALHAALGRRRWHPEIALTGRSLEGTAAFIVFRQRVMDKATQDKAREHNLSPNSPLAQQDLVEVFRRHGVIGVPAMVTPEDDSLFHVEGLHDPGEGEPAPGPIETVQAEGAKSGGGWLVRFPGASLGDYVGLIAQSGTVLPMRQEPRAEPSDLRIFRMDWDGPIRVDEAPDMDLLAGVRAEADMQLPATEDQLDNDATATDSIWSDDRNWMAAVRAHFEAAWEIEATNHDVAVLANGPMGPFRFEVLKQLGAPDPARHGTVLRSLDCFRAFGLDPALLTTLLSMTDPSRVEPHHIRLACRKVSESSLPKRMAIALGADRWLPDAADFDAQLLAWQIMTSRHDLFRSLTAAKVQLPATGSGATMEQCSEMTVLSDRGQVEDALNALMDTSQDLEAAPIQNHLNAFEQDVWTEFEEAETVVNAVKLGDATIRASSEQVDSVDQISPAWSSASSSSRWSAEAIRQSIEQIRSSLRENPRDGVGEQVAGLDAIDTALLTHRDLNRLKRAYEQMAGVAPDPRAADMILTALEKWGNIEGVLERLPEGNDGRFAAVSKLVTSSRVMQLFSDRARTLDRQLQAASETLVSDIERVMHRSADDAMDHGQISDLREFARILLLQRSRRAVARVIESARQRPEPESTQASVGELSRLLKLWPEELNQTLMQARELANDLGADTTSEFSRTIQTMPEFA